MALFFAGLITFALSALADVATGALYAVGAVIALRLMGVM